jgi:succinate-semialdehyde dehydrogenase/glutarate-semialdehyde dehydrogenase
VIVASAQSASIDVHDPATGAVIGSVPDASPADSIVAVAAAAKAMIDWRRRPPRERAEILRRCFELMTEQADSLMRLISSENGKTLADARSEVVYAAEFFRWYAEEAVRLCGSLTRSPTGTNNIMVQLEPLGPVVLVTPWNFPAAMATRKIAPALAAGCTVVLKPASETPLTALAIAELCTRAGVPDGVISVVTTSDPGPVVSAMLADPRVRGLSFTGSTEVGRTLLREAAGQVLKCSMELGGNAPFLVFADADLDAALDGLMIAKMRNGGQACTAANRLYVERAIADEFAQRFADRLAGLTVGPGTEATSDCGPLIDHRAVAKVAGLVESAVRGGASVLTGGGAPPGPGSFYTPTVLTGVASDSQIVGAEIFGPVAAFQSFETEDEVVAAANATELGLASYVYSSDLGRALRVAGHLESGMVAINRGLVSDPAAPFGGVKESGLGREGGREGVLEFTETKYIAVDW